MTSVQFEKIMLHRVEGRVLRGEEFELAELSPGVTLVHGPNGSGKSTTALAMQEMLWPGRTGLQRPSIEGWFRKGDEAWHVDIDAGHVECVRDGNAGAAPEFGPPENRRRYCLALHELIQEDTTEFATVVAHASQGGYDLASAADALDYRERPKSCSSERKRLQASRTDIVKTRSRQMEIGGNADELADLREQRKRAVSAHARINLLAKALEYHEAEQECQQLRRQQETLPPVVATLRGDERETLDQLASRRERLQNDLTSERERIRQADAELSRLRLPSEGVARNVLLQLRGLQHRLSTREAEICRQQQCLAAALGRQERARRNLGQHLTEAELASLETVEIGGLSDFARQVDRVRAHETLIEEHASRLERESCDDVRDLEGAQIREGISTLGHWLASPAPAAQPAVRHSWPVLVSAAVMALLSVVLALVHYWAWVGTVVLAGGLAAAELLSRRSAQGGVAADARKIHQQSYKKTQLQPPAAWEAGAVADLLGQLVRLAVLREKEDNRLRRLEDLDAEVKRLERQRSEMEEHRSELQQRLGLTIEVRDEWLALLIDNIRAWQQSSFEAAGVQQTLDGLENEREELLGRMNADLRTFGYDEVDSSEHAAQSIEDLGGRQSDHEQAVYRRAQAQRRVAEQLNPELQRVAEERWEILQRLGIDESEEFRIDDWLAQRPHYLELSRALTQAEAIRHNRRESLADHVDLLRLDPGEIQGEMEEQRICAERRDGLSEKIARIERDVEAAKAGHELSDALEAQDATQAALEEGRHSSGKAVTGWLLTKWVRTIAIERSRPDVFHRADALFTKFTHGTLHLTLDDHAEPPAFRAQRGTDAPRPVSELSTGERVQLLMAVRIAFLEQDETDRLPLLVDEALGNSDDGRAGVIIDSVIEIAREGRQVFYFTSQRDEVGKWVARLESAGVNHTIIDLAEVRRLAAADSRPLQIAQIEIAHLPAPDGMSYEEYGRALGVPAINATVDRLDGLHLWHVLNSAEDLHCLLRQHISTWGQLCTLVEHGGAALLEAGNDTYYRAAAVARAIERACQSWRIGRGKLVDRASLQGSGCVSDTFIDEVSDLAENLGGNAHDIIAALEGGRVTRWRTKSTDALREYFEENGFLSDEAPLSAEQIRVRVMAAVADDLRSGRISQASVDRIVGCLPM